MNYKLVIKRYLFGYIVLFLLIMAYSLINLIGLYNGRINEIILFIIINLYYIGFGLFLKKIKFPNILIYGIPILIFNSLISIMINFSFKSLVFILINYLFITFGVKLKKVSH